MDSPLDKLYEMLRCQVCQMDPREDPAVYGASYVQIDVPAMPGFNYRFALCGSCNLKLIEWLAPGTLEDPEYLELRKEFNEKFIVAQAERIARGPGHAHS